MVCTNDGTIRLLELDVQTVSPVTAKGIRCTMYTNDRTVYPVEGAPEPVGCELAEEVLQALVRKLPELEGAAEHILGVVLLAAWRTGSQ